MESRRNGYGHHNRKRSARGCQFYERSARSQSAARNGQNEWKTDNTGTGSEVNRARSRGCWFPRRVQNRKTRNRSTRVCVPGCGSALCAGFRLCCCCWGFHCSGCGGDQLGTTEPGSVGGCESVRRFRNQDNRKPARFCFEILSGIEPAEPGCGKLDTIDQRAGTVGR